MAQHKNRIALSLALATAALLSGCGGATQDGGDTQAAGLQSGQLSGVRGLAAAPQFVAPQDVDRIATGNSNTVALASNGTVYAWGNNAYGQLGNGTATSSKVPVLVKNLGPILAVAAGSYHVLALGQDGSVWAWGANMSGQLGNRQLSYASGLAAKVVGLSEVKAVSAGLAHSVAVKQDGSVWGWGTLPGQPSVAPAQVKGLSGVQTVAAGADFNLALKNDGSVWGWGGNANGQLGNGPGTRYASAPVQALGIDKVVALAAGEVHALALRRDGSVWSWGANYYGQRGVVGASPLPRPVGGLPVPVNGASGVKAVVAGPYNSAVLYTDGSVWAWGDNSIGQLGNGTMIRANAPVRLNTVANIAALSISNRFIILLGADGTVYSFGANNDGQLGNNTLSRATVPVQVVGLSGVGYLNLGKSTGR